MTSRSRVAQVASALLVAAGLGGCALSADEEPRGAGGGEETARPAAPERVETTRVEVVEDPDGPRRGIDPAALYRRLSPGVVTVISRFEGGSGGGEGGLGSGFVIDGEGRVATNAHVVTSGEGPEPERADEVFVEFADGNRVPAEIVGDDPDSDVALLKLDPAGITLRPLKLGSSATLAVGAPVAAIGSPFGEESSLSIGVISAVNRDIQSLTDFRIGNAIQTDAAINQGNSGGPLLDARGRVIGINSQIKTASGSGAGVGFAVPVDIVRRSLGQLERDGEVSYGYLGVTSQSLYPQLAERLGIGGRTGAVVASVEDDSPAEKAGLEAGEEKISFQGQEDIPSDGDVIVGVDGEPLDAANNLGDLIAIHEPGDRVRLDVFREGDRRTVEVTVGARPDRPLEGGEEQAP